MLMRNTAGAAWAPWVVRCLKHYRRLLGGLSIRGMAWLVGLLAALPLLLLLALAVRQQLLQIDRIERASQGVHVLGDLLQAQAVLGHAADLQARAEAGETGLDSAHAAMRQSAVALAQRLAAAPEAGSGPGLWPDWQPQNDRLRALLVEAGQGRAPRPAVAEGVLRLPQLAAEQSGLLAHRAHGELALAEVRVHGLPFWLGALSRLRARGAVALASGTTEVEERAELVTRAEELARRLLDVQATMESLSRSGEPPLAQWQPAAAATQRLVALTREQFGMSGAGGYGPGAYAAEVQAATGAVLALDGEIARRLDLRLAHAAEQAWRLLAVLVGGCLLALLGLVVVVRTYTAGLRHVGSVLQHSLAALAAGDLSRDVPLRGQDTLAGVARQVEQVSGRLSALVAEVRSSAVRISEAGQTVAGDNQALANRTEMQARSLGEVVQLAEGLCASVAVNAEAAQTLNALTDGLREQLDAGGQVVDQTERSILSLQDGTRRVAEINQVIDDIAFQTNLLALNASVEAARAGEAGKGFAVVAAEVRQLARRCADAAAEVRGLIDQTTMQVDEATAHIQQTTALLSRVGGGVQEVARRLNVLATASGEQRTGLDEVRERITALDDMTRDNAGAVQRSSVTAQSLAEQGDALQRAVAPMRLRQGTADEAQALVQRALAHIDAVGLEAAVADFNQGADGWVDRDLYLFGLDASNRYTVAGARPDWLGLSTFDLPGVTHAQAELFLREAGQAVAAGGGWIEYTGSHPVTKAPVAKTAYIAPLADGGLLGCGVHRQVALDGPAQLAVPPAEAEDGTGLGLQTVAAG